MQIGSFPHNFTNDGARTYGSSSERWQPGVDFEGGSRDFLDPPFSERSHFVPEMRAKRKDLGMKQGQLQFGILIATIGLAMTQPAQAAVDPNFYVFLAFGQSNMEGHATDYSDADKVSLPRFQEVAAVTCTSPSRTKDQWVPAITPLFRCNTGLSPADYFGRTLVDSLPTNIKIGLVPVAVAGTAIAGFDDRAYKAYYASQASWMSDIANLYGGNPYGRLVEMAKIAQKSGVIKGILFHQGETDGYMNGWGDTVKYIYNKLLTDLSLKAVDVPFLAGEVLPSNTGTNSGVDGLPKIIGSSAYVISSSGLTDVGDGYHFTATAYRTFGKRYAQKMLALLRQAATSIAPSANPGIPGLRVESSAQGISIHSDVAFDRMSLVSVRGEETLLGSGTDLRILPGQFHPGVYFLRAASNGAVDSRKILIER